MRRNHRVHVEPGPAGGHLAIETLPVVRGEPHVAFKTYRELPVVSTAPRSWQGSVPVPERAPKRDRAL